MRITLLGKSGKMGSYIYEKLNDTYEFCDDGDIVIDFTNASISFENIKNALENGKKVISGTTNIKSEELEELKRISIMNETSFIWVPNYSLGAVIVNEIINSLDTYFADITILETHNRSKADIPSGTAKEYAKRLKCDKIVSYRYDISKTTHEIIFDNNGERMTIGHEIFNRAAFLNGIKISIDKIIEKPYILIIGLEDFWDLLKYN